MTTLDTLTAASLAAAFKAELDQAGLTDVGCTAEVGDALYTIPGREMGIWEADAVPKTIAAITALNLEHDPRLTGKDFDLYTGAPWPASQTA